MLRAGGGRSDWAGDISVRGVRDSARGSDIRGLCGPGCEPAARQRGRVRRVDDRDELPLLGTPPRRRVHREAVRERHGAPLAGRRAREGAVLRGVPRVEIGCPEGRVRAANLRELCENGAQRLGGGGGKAPRVRAGRVSPCGAGEWARVGDKGTGILSWARTSQTAGRVRTVSSAPQRRFTGGGMLDVPPEDAARGDPGRLPAGPGAAAGAPGASSAGGCAAAPKPPADARDPSAATGNVSEPASDALAPGGGGRRGVEEGDAWWDASGPGRLGSAAAATPPAPPAPCAPGGLPGRSPLGAGAAPSAGAGSAEASPGCAAGGRGSSPESAGAAASAASLGASSPEGPAPRGSSACAAVGSPARPPSASAFAAPPPSAAPPLEADGASPSGRLSHAWTCGIPEKRGSARARSLPCE